MRARAALPLLLAALVFAAPAAGRAAETSEKERLAALPEQDRQWLEVFVAPIILPPERKAFLELTEARDREQFQEEFWKRREKDGLALPLGPGYRDRYAELRQLADSKYDHWPNDAARLVIRYGEPVSIEGFEACRRTFRDLEVWSYPAKGGMGKGIHYFFYRRSPAEPRKMWTVGTPDSDVFQPGSCRKSFPELQKECGRAAAGEPDPCGITGPSGAPAVSGTVCADVCDILSLWTEISSRQGSRTGASVETAGLLAPPDVSLEGLEGFRNRSASASDPNAKKLGVEGPGAAAPAASTAEAKPPAEKAAAAGALPAGGVVKTSSAPLTEKQALGALPPDEKQWLDFVAPIILEPEKKTFLMLAQPYEREAFKNAFWKRREQSNLPPPMGSDYRVRYEELRRIADTRYDRWPNDAAAMVIRYGEPADIRQIPECSRTFLDGLEIWTYNASGATRHYLFYRRSPKAPRQLWTIGTPESDIFAPTACRKNFAELQRDCNSPPLDPCFGPICADACDVYNAWAENQARQGSASGAQIERARLLAPAEVPLEGLESIPQRSASASDPNAKKLGVEGPGDAAPTVSAAAVKPAEKPAPAPAAGGVVKTSSAPLTEKQALAALPPDEKQWLDFVAPIILPEEKKAFLELTQPYERETFKDEFWKRRERDNLRRPFGPGYRDRYAELRQLADSQYDGWPHDAAAMVIRYGEPVSINKVDDCGEFGVTPLFRGLEIWTYSGSGGFGGSHYIFYRVDPQSPRRIWTVGTPDRDVFVPGACYTSFQALAASCNPQTAKMCTCPSACDVFRIWNEVSSRQGSVAGGGMEIGRLLEPERVPLEGLESIKQRSANAADPNAKKIGVEGPSGTTTADATAAAKAGAPAAAPGAAGSTPAPARRKLSKKEIQEVTDQLPPKYRDFVDLVDLIMTDEERQVFLQIGADYEKDKFIESFWKRRSFNSQGLRTDFKYIYLQRYQLAKEQFRNMKSERAKLLLLNGPPDALITVDCVDIYVPLQIWYYERLEALKSKVYLIFYRQYGVGEYRLWLPLDGEAVLTGASQAGGATGRKIDVTQCPDWRTVRQAMSYSASALGTGAMSMAGASVLFQPPTVETEGVEQILNMTTDVSANATNLEVTKLIRFPDQRANRIGVDLSLLVPRADLKAKQLGEEVFYNVDVIGEVVKDDRLLDNFKYRFDIPTAEVGGEKIPLTVRRYLYPGEYKLVLKIADGNQNAEGRITEMIKVPEQPDAPPPIQAAQAVSREQGRVAVDKTTKEAGLLPSAIALIPIAKEIATGLQRFETRTAEGITAVEFYLNGTKVMTRKQPPFDADLNLGPLPRKQVIKAVAYGPAGRPVGEDEYIVNEGREVFRVRILTPEKGAKATGPTPVTAAVVVPEGRALQKVEFYSNETRVATLYQAPWEQTINLRDTKSLGYVRVVGTLEDGTVAEDVRYVNAPSYISEVSVDAVELYTTVTDKSSRPVAGLQQSNFKVFEDGVAQKVESFEYVKNVPLSLGVLVDTSASMLEALPEAQQAAIAFLDYSIGPKDRGFTISFDTEPYILSKLTNRKDKLFRSLAGLRAEGSTSLYDAIVYGLYQFTGVKGKKAVVILSDGKDTSSKFDFDTLLEYVKKSGIAIYAIGLKIPGAELDVKYKLNKLAQVTGGQTFMIDSVKGLEGVYRQINDELRSQYLLTYYSTNAEGKDRWRKVEVKVEPTNLVARTLSGYYP